MDVNKIMQVAETEKHGYREFTLIVKTSLPIDPYVNIPDEYIAHALCNNLREYVNSSVVSDNVIKYVEKPIQYTKEICK